jgi:hypothetical protein
MFDQMGKQRLVVDGCGKRALYFWDVRFPAPNTREYHAVLSGLVPLSAPAGSLARDAG